MKTFTFYNRKGGSGKTTLLLLLAAYLRYCLGFRVKVVDVQCPEYPFAFFRNLDKKNSHRDGSYFSNFLKKRDNRTPYPIENAGKPVNEYSVKDLREFVWKINEEVRRDEYDYLLIDFPALFSKSTPISCLIENHLLDGMYIPFSTDAQESSDAFILGQNFWSRGLPCRLLWNRLQVSYLKEKAEDLDESDRTLASYGLDVSKVRIKAFNKATEASDVRCFVRNTLCWPDRYVKMVCPELIPLFDEIVEFLDKD